MDVSVTVAVPRLTPTSSRRRCSTAAAGPRRRSAPARPRRHREPQGLAVVSRQRHLHRAGQVREQRRAAARSRARRASSTRSAPAAAVTPPPGKLLTRKPDSFVHQHVPARRDAEPGRDLVRDPLRAQRRRAARRLARRDSKSAFVDTTSGLANFSFDKPGRYVIVARAERDGFFSGWSAPTVVNAIAPFDLGSVKFPDHKGPSYKLKARSASTPRAARSRSTSPRARRRASSTSSARPRSARRAASRSASRSATPASTGCATSTGATARWRPAA